MKRGQTIAFFWLAAAIVIGCSSTASNTQPRTSQTASRGREPSGPYFTGSGGKGMSLAILVLESAGLNENQAYLPRMVQGALVSNISKYSAISVLDRVSLDKVIAETLDPTYEINFDIVRIGHVAQVGYMMTGNITRTTTGYALQLNVTETTNAAKTIASYSGTSTVAQLDDFSAIHRASGELLEQMGVELTNAAKNELGKASSSHEVRAQTNLAQGIVAQQKGTVVEAMAYYYDAVSFDPKLSEASGRLSTLSSNISSGNIGENVRNDIQRRNEWLKILAECESYFSKHPPYEIIYDSSLTQQGAVDYANESVNLSFKMTVKPTTAFQVLQNILDGLDSTGKKAEWGLANWPLSSPSFCDASVIYNPFDGKLIWGGKYPFDIDGILGENWGISSLTLAKPGRAIMIKAALVNEHGKTIATTGRLFFEWVALFQGKKGTIIEGDVEKLMKTNWDAEMNWEGTGNISVTKQYITRMNQPVVFSKVKANDITDNLTIKIVSVNGVDVSRSPDYIRITTGKIENEVRRR